MKPIPILGLGTQSKSSNVTAQKRINMYIEIQGDPDKASVVAFGTPGLTLRSNQGDTTTRGIHSLGDYIYKVHRGTLYRENNAGVSVAKGTIDTTTGYVGMANNGLQIHIATGVSGYIYTIATDTLVKITDVDYPGGDSPSFLDGYFIIAKPATGEFYISASYNGLSWDSLKFATAESNPDNLVATAVSRGSLVLLGDLSTETWLNTDALDFPFSRISISSGWGLAAKRSVAQSEDSLILLAKNRTGEVRVVRLSGSSYEKISTFDMDTIFNNYANISDATAFSYQSGGHTFYQINFPTELESWLYDSNSNAWSQLKSGTSRHLAEMGVQYQNKTVVTDYSNGKLYNIDANVYADNGAMIVGEITGKHLSNGLELFSIGMLQVDMETGVGIATGQGSDPQMMLQVSKDGGHNFGNERWVSIGKIGEFKTRARWPRLGIARDWVFRLRISDPVPRKIIGAYIT